MQSKTKQSVKIRQLITLAKKDLFLALVYLKGLEIPLLYKIKIMDYLLLNSPKNKVNIFINKIEKSIPFKLSQDVYWLLFFPSSSKLPSSAFFFPKHLKKYKQDWMKESNMAAIVTKIKTFYASYFKLKSPNNKFKTDQFGLNILKQEFIVDYIKTVKNKFPSYLERIILHRLILDSLTEEEKNDIIEEIESNRGNNVFVWIA